MVAHVRGDDSMSHTDADERERQIDPRLVARGYHDDRKPGNGPGHLIQPRR